MHCHISKDSLGFSEIFAGFNMANFWASVVKHETKYIEVVLSAEAVGEEDLLVRRKVVKMQKRVVVLP